MNYGIQLNRVFELLRELSALIELGNNKLNGGWGWFSRVYVYAVWL